MTWTIYDQKHIGCFSIKTQYSSLRVGRVCVWCVARHMNKINVTCISISQPRESIYWPTNVCLYTLQMWMNARLTTAVVMPTPRAKIRLVATYVRAKRDLLETERAVQVDDIERVCTCPHNYGPSIKYVTLKRPFFTPPVCIWCREPRSGWTWSWRQTPSLSAVVHVQRVLILIWWLDIASIDGWGLGSAWKEPNVRWPGENVTDIHTPHPFNQTELCIIMCQAKYICFRSVPKIRRQCIPWALSNGSCGSQPSLVRVFWTEYQVGSWINETFSCVVSWAGLDMSKMRVLRIPNGGNREQIMSYVKR